MRRAVNSVLSKIHLTYNCKIIVAVVLQLIVLGMTASVWWITSPEQLQKRQREQFFQTQMHLLLDHERDRNSKAIASARQLLDEKFKSYSERVPKFVEELTSLSSGYQITKAMIKDAWNKSEGVSDYVIQLFGEQVVSHDKLRSDVEEVVAQFRRELEANRNWMLAEATQRLTTATFPVPASISSQDGLFREFRGGFPKFLETRAKGLPGDKAKVLAEEVTRHLIEKAVAPLQRRMIEAISARLASAITGGARSAGGTTNKNTWGTAIGAVLANIAVNAVQAWMESRFQKELIGEVNSTLDQMRASIWGTAKDGLEANLRQLIEIARKTHEQALRKVVVGDA